MPTGGVASLCIVFGLQTSCASARASRLATRFWLPGLSKVAAFPSVSADGTDSPGHLATLSFQGHVEMTGVPPHAWVTGTAEMILGPSCWVERLGTTMASQEDMGRFSVIAWTDNPEKMAKEFQFGIPEPPTPYDPCENDLRVPSGQMVPEAVSALYYPVVVHLLRVEDRECYTDVSSPEGGSSSGDDSNDPRRDPDGGSSPRRPRTLLPVQAWSCGWQAVLEW